MSETAETRAALAQLIEQRRGAEERLTAARNSYARLEGAAAGVSPVEAELRALDAEEAAAMTAWSAGEGGELPTPDTEKRVEIQGRLQKARATAAAASTAAATAQGDMERTAGIVSAIGSRVATLALQIALAEVQPAIDTAHSASIDAAAKRRHTVTMRNRLLELAEANGKDQVPREFHVALERIDEEIKATFLGIYLDPAADRDSIECVHGLLARLETDAAATLSAAA